MNAQLGPSTRRRQLARELRELRKKAGIATIKMAAELSGLSHASISRMEQAKQVILPRSVRLLCQTYGVGAPQLDYLLRLAEEAETRGWVVAYSDTTPDWLGRYVAEEAEAEWIQTFETAFVPGLLQTPAYCRAVAEASRREVDQAAVDRTVDFRMRRQGILDDERVQLEAIVSEAALRQVVGGPETMQEQLRHLLHAAERPNVALQVLGFAAGAHPGMVGAFSVLHFPTADTDAAVPQPTIFCEVDSGALYRDRSVDFERYSWVWERLQALALAPDETADLIESILTHLDQG